jgi:hypothetical protein
LRDAALKSAANGVLFARSPHRRKPKLVAMVCGRYSFPTSPASRGFPGIDINAFTAGVRRGVAVPPC